MTKEHESLAAAVSEYAQAAYRVLDAIYAWEKANPHLDYGTLLDKFPHEESMEDVVNRIANWRDALRGDI